MVIQCVLEISSEQYYSCELTQRVPIRVRIVTINGDTGLGIIESLEGGEASLQRYVRELNDSSSILRVDITYRSPTSYWTYVVHQLDSPSIYESILQSGYMTFLPILIERGVQKHTILAPTREALSDLLNLLRERFTSVRVRQIRASRVVPSPDVLTSKQKEAFTFAFESRYYAIPRKCSVEELASAIGIKRVAMQEKLRRAEYRIFSRYLEE